MLNDFVLFPKGFIKINFLSRQKIFYEHLQLTNSSLIIIRASLNFILNFSV